MICLEWPFEREGAPLGAAQLHAEEVLPGVGRVPNPVRPATGFEVQVFLGSVVQGSNLIHAEAVLLGVGRVPDHVRPATRFELQFCCRVSGAGVQLHKRTIHMPHPKSITPCQGLRGL